MKINKLVRSSAVAMALVLISFIALPAWAQDFSGFSGAPTAEQIQQIQQQAQSQAQAQGQSQAQGQGLGAGAPGGM
ncbi:MAG: hypothetical protein Q8L21_02090, partial [Candidatus Komeilibacteria bacterium]|nr:hypothetical protein [Candidatus Komeilibacteria bacterium]